MRAYLRAVANFNRNVHLFVFACAIHGLAFFGIYSLLLNLYLLRLGYGEAFIGQVNAIGPFALAIASLPAGAFSRRYGSRLGLIIAFLSVGLGLGLLPFNEFLPIGWQKVSIFTSYASAWFFGSLFVVNIAPFLMGTTSPQERNYAFAVQTAVMPLCGFAGNLLGGLLPGFFALLLGSTLAQAAPYRLVLILAGALEFVAGLAMWWADEVDVETVKRPESGNRQSALPLLLISLIALVWMLRVGSEWLMRVFFNVYLDTVLATPTASIGGLLAVGQLCGLAALFSPLVIARFGKERTIIGGMIGIALAFLPLLFVSHWLAVGLGFMLMIALASISGPAYIINSQELVQPQWRTTISSAMSMMLGIGIALVAFGGGYVIVGYGYPALFTLGALLALGATLLYGLYFYKPRGELVQMVGEQP